MNRPTATAFVHFAGFMHEFCLTNLRAPRFEEVPQSLWRCWLWNDYTASGRNWVRGFLVQALVHRFLEDQGCDVFYMAEIDVHRGVDLMVNCRPVQVKSREPAVREDGIDYLIVSEFYGSFTSRHKTEILDQVAR